MEQPLLHFKCQCLLEDGVRVLQEHLSKSRKILDSGDYRTDAEFSRLLKSLQKAADELKRQQAEHLKFRIEYAREMIDLVKEQAINVGPQQQKLQTVPYLTGTERKPVVTEKKRGKKRSRKP